MDTESDLEIGPVLKTFRPYMNFLLGEILPDGLARPTRKKQKLYIVYPLNDDPTAINAALLTSYLNRMIIDEEEQFEIEAIVDLEQNTDEDLGSRLISQQLKALGNTCLSGNTTQKLNCYDRCTLALFSLCFGSMLICFNKIAERWIPFDDDDDVDSYKHFLIGTSESSWNSLTIDLMNFVHRQKNTTVTHISGYRSKIVRKAEITNVISEPKESSIFSRLWNSPMSSSPTTSGTIGDDIDLFFDEMRMEKLENSLKTFKGYPMLSENELKEYEAQSDALLERIRGKIAKNSSTLNENLFFESICTRKTKILK